MSLVGLSVNRCFCYTFRWLPAGVRWKPQDTFLGVCSTINWHDGAQLFLYVVRKRNPSDSARLVFVGNRFFETHDIAQFPRYGPFRHGPRPDHLFGKPVPVDMSDHFRLAQRGPAANQPGQTFDLPATLSNEAEPASDRGCCRPHLPVLSAFEDMVDPRLRDDQTTRYFHCLSFPSGSFGDAKSG